MTLQTRKRGHSDCGLWKTHNDTPTMGKSFAIDCTTRFDEKSEVYFYWLPKVTEQRSKWIAAIHRNNWTPGSESWIWSIPSLLYLYWVVIMFLIVHVLT